MRFFAFGVLVAGVLLSRSTESQAVVGHKPGLVVQGVAQQQANHQVSGELHGVRSLLERADHDYKGHRVKAIHHITQAIQHLHGGKDPHHDGRGGEPQKLSDEQLKQAVQQLQVVEKHLARSHPHAQQEVSNAIKELHTALKIK